MKNNNPFISFILILLVIGLSQFATSADAHWSIPESGVLDFPCVDGPVQLQLPQGGGDVCVALGDLHDDLFDGPDLVPLVEYAIPPGDQVGANDDTQVCFDTEGSYDVVLFFANETICSVVIEILPADDCVPDVYCLSTSPLDFGDLNDCGPVSAVLDLGCDQIPVEAGVEFVLEGCNDNFNGQNEDTRTPWDAPGNKKKKKDKDDDDDDDEGGDCWELADDGTIIIYSSTVSLIVTAADGSTTVCELCIPEGECKIEGSDIGADGLVIVANGVEITFVNWIPKDDSPGEYVGFEIEASGPVSYKIKAGRDIFYGNTLYWVNPNGTSGPQAKAISYIDFCPPDDFRGGNSGNAFKAATNTHGVAGVDQLSVYPNPVSDIAVVSYGLAETSDIRIDLLDVNGRMVSQLVSGSYAEGPHQLRFNASDFGPGVYLVSLSTPTGTYTQRIIISD